MKTTLLIFVLAVLSFLGLASQAQAQVVYQSIANGAWTNPATWLVVSAPIGSTPARFPAPNANNVVTVATNVTLNINYDVSGNNGFLTVSTGGSIAHTGQFTLTVGEQVPNATTRILVQPRITAGPALSLYKLEFIKALGTINAPIQTASCVTFNNNVDLVITSSLTVNGNLLITQGNSSVNAGIPLAGSLFVRGLVDGRTTAPRNFGFATTTVVGANINCNDLVPLPVELTRFVAVFESNQVNLRWATASEKNAADFTVERSVDGKIFSAIATVRAAGTSNSPREYTATDRAVRDGLHYYRLKQTDLDGTFVYTQVIPVQVSGVDQQLQAYGDNGSLNVVMQTAGTLKTLRVLDNMGRVVYTESPAGPTTGLVTRRISVPGATGRRMYMVQAITSQGVLNGKFLLEE